MNATMTWLRAASLWLLLALAAPVPVYAHDPFDGAAQMRVFDERIELTVTLGSDAARLFLASLALPPARIATMTRQASGDALLDLPADAAPRLMRVDTGAGALAARSFALAPNDNEIAFRIVYPRPAGESVLVSAGYFTLSGFMKSGTLVAADHQRRMLASALLSAASPAARVPLTLQAAQAAAAPAMSFGAFFKLGVTHILGGFDHLLFLCALLITIRAVRPMLAIVTAFTLAHSVTLALAALDLVVVRAAVIEPLIALSIIVAAAVNLSRREVDADRIWMAAGFGLLHGFGFAGALRETGMIKAGGSIVMPLLSFNLGVEAGQLLVASVAIPLLMLARRTGAFARYGAPALSAMVIVLSSYWLLQRLQMA